MDKKTATGIEKWDAFLAGQDEVKQDGHWVEVWEYEFDNQEQRDEFLAEVGGAPHPLGGDCRAILTVTEHESESAEVVAFPSISALLAGSEELRQAVDEDAELILDAMHGEDYHAAADLVLELAGNSKAAEAYYLQGSGDDDLQDAIYDRIYEKLNPVCATGYRLAYHGVTVQVTCPECETTWEVNLAQGVRCPHCEWELPRVG